MPKSAAIFFSFANRPPEEKPSMWKATASVLCGCLAALPLIGCAGGGYPERPVAASAPPVIADSAPDYGNWSPRIYATGPSAPAAVLVFLPAIGTPSSAEFLAREPRLWAAQGFDVVMPQPSDFYRLIANEQTALARLVASAQALSDAPIWLVGSSPVIDAALASAPPLGRGKVSGVVVTSVSSNTGSCSESVFYSDPGTGAAPKIEVRKSGDCEAGPAPPSGRYPSVLPAPAARPNAPRIIETRAPAPNAPRIIEASSVARGLPTADRVERLAQMIKASPSS
jgi:hypothetical protein